MIILTWNVRGLGEQTKRFGVRDFRQLNFVDIVCLQETKSILIVISLDHWEVIIFKVGLLKMLKVPLVDL